MLQDYASMYDGGMDVRRVYVSIKIKKGWIKYKIDVFSD